MSNQIEDYEAIANMTDAQAAEILEQIHLMLTGGRVNGKSKLSMSYNIAIQKGIKALKSTAYIMATAAGVGYEAGKEKHRTNWVPLKYRPLTEEERIKFSDYWGVEYCDTLSEQAFDCQMPEDGQEILLTTKWGVEEDVCSYDPDEGYSLEDRGDWDGVIAWMPKPEPYKEDEETNNDRQ